MGVILKHYLRRYVSSEDGLAYLRAGSIALGEYAHWKDISERASLEAYEDLKSLTRNSLRLACFTQAPETYHHWNLYARKGLCFILRREQVEEQASQVGIRCQSVEYTKVASLKDTNLESWPFLKRLPYQDEQEYRLISDAGDNSIQLTPDSVERIYLSPWLSAKQENEVRDMVRGRYSDANGCAIKVSKTTILENEQWIKYFKEGGAKKR